MNDTYVIDNVNQPEKRMSSKVKKKINSISHDTALASLDTLSEFIDQWGFKYDDIIAFTKIHIDIRKSLKDFYKLAKMISKY